MTSPKLAVEGWFTPGDEPRLLGGRCTTCSTVVFPNRRVACPNPACQGREFDEVPLSRTGTVWSYTANHYPPPAPYVAPDPFEPYTVAAVELSDERMVVLGQVEGEVELGDEVELVTGEWRSSASACTRGASGAQLRRVRRDRRAGGAGRRRHRLARRPVRRRRRDRAQRLPRLRGRAPRSPRRWAGRECRSRPPTPRARRAPMAIDVARAADPRRAVRRRARRRCGHDPQGLPRPRRRAGDDPDWLRFRLLGATNPTYFACTPAAAWTCTARPTTTSPQGQGEERPPRPRQPLRPLPQGGHREEVLASPMVADPLRLLDICATSDGGAAVVLSRWTTPGATYGADPGTGGGRLDGDTDVPEHGHRDAELRHRLRGGRRPEPDTHVPRGHRRTPPTPRPASAPTTSTSPRSTTCPPRSSSTGTRTSACAHPARPRSSCATATRRSAAGSRSTRPAGSPASARPSPPRRSPRSASSPGSCAARPRAARSRALTSG
jgi:uncharacterized protein